MNPGHEEPDRLALVATLRRMTEKPTDFTYAEISVFAGMAADELATGVGASKPAGAKRAHVEGQRTVDDEDPGSIPVKGRPSVYG